MPLDAGKGMAALCITLLLGTAASHAQIAVTSNDGHQPHLGDTPDPRDFVPDTVTVIDMSRDSPLQIGSVNVPASMIGPPTSVAVSHDNRFAIVTSAQKPDPVDGSKVTPDDRVSVIDLRAPRHPILAQTLVAGDGATGVAINHDDTLALVANVQGASLSVFSVVKGRLTPAGTVTLSAPANGRPGAGDVAFTPDGSTALVTQRFGTGIWRLAVENGTVKETGTVITTGVNPYGLEISPDGRFAFNTNLGGRILPPDPSGKRAQHPGTVTAIDLSTNTVASTVEVGPTPEHLALSQDGKYMEVTVVNGSSAKPGAPGYQEFGLMKVYRVDGGNLTEVAETKTGKWGQGAVFSKDNHTILLQTAIDKVIEVYRFDGKTLTRDDAATLHFTGRPGTISTSFSR